MLSPFPGMNPYLEPENTRGSFRCRFLPVAAVLVACFAVSGEAAAFNEPVDSAGPLTVRIEGLTQVTAVEKPLTVTLHLANAGESAVSGSLRLAVIDRWRVEPKDAVPFTVAAKETARIAFQVVAGQGTHNAHYPIHAYAEFSNEDRKLVAHPILVLETRLADPPRPGREIPWQPIEVGAEGGLSLGRLPVQRVVVRPFNAAPQVMPTGWTGSEPTTRASVQFAVREQRGRSREAIAVHPPWYEGRKGTLWIEFPLRLPAGRPLRLRFGQAIRDQDAARGEPPSDGVTFRVRVVSWDAAEAQAGEVIYERHTASKQWEDAEVDLSRFAGQTVRVQLECHPGPRGDTTCDQAFWAEPTLVVGEGKPQPAGAGLRDADARRLGTVDIGVARYDVVLWPGKRGLLDSTVGFLAGPRRLLFHGFRVQVLGVALEDVNSPAVLRDVVEETAADVRRWRHRFRSWAGDFEVVGELQVREGTLQARFGVENAPPPQPWQVVYLEGVELGPWSETAQRVYAGTGNVIERPEAFRLAFDGHRLASSFVGFDFLDNLSLVQAVDVPPDHLEVDPQSRRYSLRTPHTQTITLIPSPDVWSAVSRWRTVNGLRPAGGVEKLAGRFVFDLWGGRYGESAAALQRAFRYGLTDAVVVWHNWQRWGYDYRLPDIVPPNPDLGTADEFRRLAQVCRENGVLFAPHDNYIDFYPDADNYSYDQIAFTAEGRPVRAWLNEGRQAQSYRWRADRVRTPLEKNVGWLRDACAPTAYFIDVWSSIGPYDYWTADGAFRDRVSTRNTWGEAFAWIRDCLGDHAPQISESGHDQLVGWLDGAQTNHLRVDVPPEGYYGWAVWPIRCGDAERIPWFDAAHHDRFVLHGAGYESRYAAGLDRRLHGIDSDDYITTEMLTGHPAMVAAPFGREVVRKYWLTHDLIRALALQRIEKVEFVEGNLHRQHVQWSGPGEVWVNRSDSDWAVAGRTLPPDGFYGRVALDGKVVEAAIERREGIVVDWSRTSSSLFANARPVLRSGLPITAAVESVSWKGGRTIEVVFRWEATEPLPAELTPFAHFVDGRGRVQFQADQQPPRLAAAWNGMVRATASVTIPAELSPGQTVELRVGLIHAGGRRALLQGADDGSRRIRLGTLRLDGRGEDLQGVAWTPLVAGEDPFLERLNPAGKMIEFDGLATDGACRLSGDEKTLQLVPLPDGKPFTVRLAPGVLRRELPPSAVVECLAEDGATLRRLTAQREGDRLVLPCEPGVFEYRVHAPAR